jgi:hypothetical protein
MPGHTHGQTEPSVCHTVRPTRRLPLSALDLPPAGHRQQADENREAPPAQGDRAAPIPRPPPGCGSARMHARNHLPRLVSQAFGTMQASASGPRSPRAAPAVAAPRLRRPRGPRDRRPGRPPLFSAGASHPPETPSTHGRCRCCIWRSAVGTRSLRQRAGPRGVPAAPRGIPRMPRRLPTQHAATASDAGRAAAATLRRRPSFPASGEQARRPLQRSRGGGPLALAAACAGRSRRSGAACGVLKTIRTPMPRCGPAVRHRAPTWSGGHPFPSHPIMIP